MECVRIAEASHLTGRIASGRVASRRAKSGKKESFAGNSRGLTGKGPVLPRVPKRTTDLTDTYQTLALEQQKQQHYESCLGVALSGLGLSGQPSTQKCNLLVRF